MKRRDLLAASVGAMMAPRFTGIRRIDKAKLFFPEEYPDIIAEEARLLWEPGRSLVLSCC
jgi:hypothetical protein